MSQDNATKKTILVIEDNLDFSEFITTVLKDQGYETELVMDGAKAIERAKEIQPACITLDVLLPGKTGISIYRELRKSAVTKNIPVVIITGVGTEGKKLKVDRFFQGRQIPAPDGVLQKRIEPEALIDAVSKAVNRISSAPRSAEPQ